MEAASVVSPARLSLVPPSADDVLVGERERLEKLYDELMRLAEDVDPLRAAVLRTWARTVRGWIRLARR
jgi:hypothetical protein